jgi:hypothetical protein
MNSVGTNRVELMGSETTSSSSQRLYCDLNQSLVVHQLNDTKINNDK